MSGHNTGLEVCCVQDREEVVTGMGPQTQPNALK